jgi:RimJ/RimL family protein N-acetyltransferase
MGEVRIITLDPERWAEFRELRLQALRGDPAAFGSSYEESREEPEAFWRGRLEDAQRKIENITLFAEIDGRLVGMMGMFRRVRIKTKHVATVFGVYVDPAARGRGIAGQLMQALLDEISLIPEIVKLELTVNTENPVALALYRRFGFEICGTAHRGLKIGERYYDEHQMEKLL